VSDVFGDGCAAAASVFTTWKISELVNATGMTNGELPSAMPTGAPPSTIYWMLIFALPVQSQTSIASPLPVIVARIKVEPIAILALVWLLSKGLKLEAPPPRELVE